MSIETHRERLSVLRNSRRAADCRIGQAGMKTIDWTSALSRSPRTGYVQLLTGNTGGLIAVKPTFVEAPNVSQQFIGERGVQDGSVL